MRMRLVLAATICGGLGIAATPAMAAPESCAKDFAPLMTKRQAYINTINGYKNKKPSAPAACSTFSGLSAQNRKISAWMESQKDWCQIPDDTIKAIKDQQAQIDKTRANACNAAAQQSKMMRQMKNQQQRQQAGPGIGSGVRLPQGAL